MLGRCLVTKVGTWPAQKGMLYAILVQRPNYALIKSLARILYMQYLEHCVTAELWVGVEPFAGPHFGYLPYVARPAMCSRPEADQQYIAI